MTSLKQDLVFYAVAGLAGYAVYRKFFGAPTEQKIPEDSPIAVGGALGGVLQTSYNLGEETGGALGDFINWLRGSGAPGAIEAEEPWSTQHPGYVPIMTRPDPAKIPEIVENVAEYLKRHPALTPADYFSQYPSVAWAEEMIREIPGVERGTYSIPAAEPVQVVAPPAPVAAAPVSTAPPAVSDPDYDPHRQIGGGYTAATAVAAGATHWVSGVGWVG